MVDQGLALGRLSGMFRTANPEPQRLDVAAHLFGDRSDRRPLRAVLGLMIARQPDGAFAKPDRVRLRRLLRLHGPLLSKSGPPENSARFSIFVRANTGWSKAAHRRRGKDGSRRQRLGRWRFRAVGRGAPFPLPVGVGADERHCPSDGFGGGGPLVPGAYQGRLTTGGRKPPKVVVVVTASDGHDVIANDAGGLSPAYGSGDRDVRWIRRAQGVRRAGRRLAADQVVLHQHVSRTGKRNSVDVTAFNIVATDYAIIVPVGGDCSSAPAALLIIQEYSLMVAIAGVKSIVLDQEI